MISRDRQLEVIDKITSSKRMRSLGVGHGRAWRRERVQFLVNFASERVNSGVVDSSTFKSDALEEFEAEYGSAILTFLLFQFIWYMIQKHLLD